LRSVDQILAEYIQTDGKTLLSEMHTLIIKSIWIREGPIILLTNTKF
jgi:hypothetical protein